MLGFAAVAGMVDFLLPVLPFFGIPFKEVGFITRLADCVLYLPPFVLVVRDYDNLLIGGENEGVKKGLRTSVSTQE